MKPEMIRIAWTFDDGPTEYTALLMDRLQQLNIRAVTWFVCRRKVHHFNYWDQLKAIQDNGGEIAMHEIHPELDNVNWIPGGRNAYQHIEQAINDMNEFYQELTAKGIAIRFARLPGGEMSELAVALQKLNCPTPESFYWAMQIIDGNPVPENYQNVQADYERLLEGLNKLGITIWSGASGNDPVMGGMPFHYNSWQAECAGIAAGRGADNITLHQAPARKAAGIVEQNVGVFERTLSKTRQTREPGSIVILAHDTSVQDLEEMEEDRKRMEMLAGQHQVDLHYCTLSGLYAAIRKNIHSIQV